MMIQVCIPPIHPQTKSKLSLRLFSALGPLQVTEEGGMRREYQVALPSFKSTFEGREDGDDMGF